MCHVLIISPILLAHSSVLKKQTMHFYDRAASVGVCLCVCVCVHECVCECVCECVWESVYMSA
jgi:hypothetical protein